MPTHTLAAIVDQVSFLPQRTGGTRHGRIRATNHCRRLRAKSCLFVFFACRHQVFVWLFQKTFEGRSPATFLICLPFPILRDWRISNDTALLLLVQWILDVLLVREQIWSISSKFQNNSVAKFIGLSLFHHAVYDAAVGDDQCWDKQGNQDKTWT